MANKQFTKGTKVLLDISEQCLEDTKRWFGDKPHVNTLLHQTLGMCGEVGEFANVVKKIDKGQLNINDASTKVRLTEELADVFTYLMSLAGILQVDMEKNNLSLEADKQSDKRRVLADLIKARNGR